jgi:hypothetical protein
MIIVRDFVELCRLLYGHSIMLLCPSRAFRICHIEKTRKYTTAEHCIQSCNNLNGIEVFCWEQPIAYSPLRTEWSGSVNIYTNITRRRL